VSTNGKPGLGLRDHQPFWRTAPNSGATKGKRRLTNTKKPKKR